MSTADPDNPSLLVQVVTCRKSPEERRISALREIGSLDRDFETEIVDGFVAEDDIIDRLYDAALNRWRSKRPLSRSEVGVYASHRLAWQQLLDSRHAAGLVVEDDFALRDRQRVAAVLDAWAEVLGEGRDIVKLFDFEKKKVNRVVFRDTAGGVPLVKWSAPTAGMVAYLISRAGARKLLARDRVYRQVDEDLKHYWELGLDIWSVPGNPVAEVSDKLGGSLIDDDRENLRNRVLARSLWGNVLTAERKIRTRLALAREAVARRGGRRR